MWKSVVASILAGSIASASVVFANTDKFIEFVDETIIATFRQSCDDVIKRTYLYEEAFREAVLGDKSEFITLKRERELAIRLIYVSDRCEKEECLNQLDKAHAAVRELQKAREKRYDDVAIRDHRARLVQISEFSLRFCYNR